MILLIWSGPQGIAFLNAHVKEPTDRQEHQKCIPGGS